MISLYLEIPDKSLRPILWDRIQLEHLLGLDKTMEPPRILLLKLV